MLAVPAVIRLLYLLYTDTQPPSLAAKSIIISACYERGDSALSPQPRERLSESESNILVIIKVFVSLGGEKLDKLVSVPIIHLSCLDIVYLGVAAASGLEAGMLMLMVLFPLHNNAFIPQASSSYLLEQCRNSNRTCDPRNMSTGMGSLICSAQRGLLLWYSTKEWYSSAPGSPEPAAT